MSQTQHSAESGAKGADGPTNSDKQAAIPQNPTPTGAISNPEQRNGESARDNPIERYTRQLSHATVGLVIVGIVTAGVLFLQFCELKKTDETARLAQRAFVAVREIVVTPIGPLQLPRSIAAPEQIAYRIAMFWENSGATEPRDLEIGHGIAIDARATNPSWPLSPVGQKRVLLPRAVLEQGDLTTGALDLNAARDGRHSIFIFGFAKYLDAFGMKHLTLACFRLGVAPVDYTKEGAKGVSATQCREYNCADQECRRYSSVSELKPLLAFLD